MRNSKIENCNLINLSQIQDRKGNITPVTNHKEIPFEIRRVFYIYDIPGGENRGGHSHKECHQLLVAVSGSFEVELDDGFNKKIIKLNRPNFGLHIPPGVWAAEKSFSSGSVCLVITSDLYDEKDYIRNYLDFKNYKNE